MTFTEAEALCQSKVSKGHLASITSLQEAHFLGNLQVQSGLKTQDAWLGAVSMADEIDYLSNFKWHWLDETLYNDVIFVSMWAPGEPNGVLGNNDGLLHGGTCLSINKRAAENEVVTWNDADCSSPRRAFCKVYYPDTVLETSTITTTKAVVTQPVVAVAGEATTRTTITTTQPGIITTTTSEDAQLACAEMGVPDWVLYGKACYIYIPSTLNFADAQSRCASEFPNAVLASAPTYEVNAFLGDLQSSSGLTTHAAWLGGKSDALLNNGNQPFAWADGTPFETAQTSFLWAANEPNGIFNEDGDVAEEMCIATLRRYGDAHRFAPEWNDAPCDLNNRFFCKVNLPTTSTSSTSTVTTETTTSATVSTTSITTTTTRTTITTFTDPTTTATTTTSTTYTTTTSTTSTSTITTVSSTTTTMSSTTTTTITTTTTTTTITTTSLTTTPLPKTCASVGFPEWQRQGMSCYYFNMNSLRFNQAELACQEFSEFAHLASVQRPEESQYLGSIEKKFNKGKPRDAWIGGLYNENVGAFEWVDDVNFELSPWFQSSSGFTTPFAAGEPSDAQKLAKTPENCIALAKRKEFSDPVLWNDAICTFFKRSFCKLSIEDLDDTTSTTSSTVTTATATTSSVTTVTSTTTTISTTTTTIITTPPPPGPTPEPTTSSSSTTTSTSTTGLLEPVFESSTVCDMTALLVQLAPLPQCKPLVVELAPFLSQTKGGVLTPAAQCDCYNTLSRTQRATVQPECRYPTAKENSISIEYAMYECVLYGTVMGGTTVTSTTTTVTENPMNGRPCPGMSSSWRLFDGNCYVYIPFKSTFAAAKLTCQQLETGSAIASVLSLEENIFLGRLQSQFSPNNMIPTWLGAEASSSDGTWSSDGKTWTDGQPFATTFWDYQEPNMPSNGASCIATVRRKVDTMPVWKDSDCTATRPVFCKMVQPDTTTSITSTTTTTTTVSTTTTITVTTITTTSSTSSSTTTTYTGVNTTETTSTPTTTEVAPVTIDITVNECAEIGLPAWTLFGTSCYFFPGSVQLVFHEAGMYCSSIVTGAYLATVTDEAEQNELNLLMRNAISKPKSAWIGAVKSQDTFIWLDGTTEFSYSNFAEGEPNNGGMVNDQPENCLAVGERKSFASPMLWNDGFCFRPKRFFCEVPVATVVANMEPTTTTSTSTSTSSTSVTTVTPPTVSCETIMCGRLCIGECGWSSGTSKCKRGGSTTKKEALLFPELCPIDDANKEPVTDCASITCVRDCKGECGWSTNKGRCLLGGNTNKKEKLAFASTCQPIPKVSVCNDVLIDGMAWFDGDAAEYTCYDYKMEDLCVADGDFYTNAGHTANTACCACGGGMSVEVDKCRDIKCGAQCNGPCGWHKGKCKTGKNTSTKELQEGDCPVK
jgi:hypothetical protein